MTLPLLSIVNLGAPATVPVWITWISALGPTLVAACVGAIAYRQWRTAQAKVRVDLFNLRVAVYNEVLLIARLVATGEEFDLPMRVRYLTSTQDAEWLFDRALEQYISGHFHQHLQKRSDRLAALRQQLDNAEAMNPGPSSEALFKERMKFSEELEVMRSKFAKYLQLHH